MAPDARFRNGLSSKVKVLSEEVLEHEVVVPHHVVDVPAVLGDRLQLREHGHRCAGEALEAGLEHVEAVAVDAEAPAFVRDVLEEREDAPRCE